MKNKAEILAINQKQSAFYNHKKRNAASRLWSKLREGGLKNLRRELGILGQCYDLHKTWLGDISNKKILDLGCYEGNALSVYMAENAQSYIGIDLSEKGIKVLSQKINHIPSAKAICVDFLSDDFTEKDFDIIYAYGVLHHFENVPLLAQTLKNKLVAGGRIIAYDPLKTSWPVWIARSIYRPFQSDALWEFPFGRKTLKTLEMDFTFKETRGVLGWSKYFLLFLWLPFHRKTILKWAKKTHAFDWEKSANKKSHLYRCMQLNLLLEKI